MRTSSKLLVIGALLALGSAACSDWLSGPGVTNDPNAPSTASRDQRLAAVQAGMTAQLTGALARTACMWMQQCAGVDRQYATLEKYNTTEDDFDTEFSQVYSGGGLVDIRAIASDALGAGDSVYTGVAKVLEALDVGTAADLWGDIPYSQAAGNNGTPVFDKQQDIYLRVLAVLDTAITDLAGKGSGPGGIDLWYGGDHTKWSELAHTLKARFYLHLAERNGVPAYTSALAEANQGISSASHDLVSFQSTVTSENNLWYQFQVVQRDTYLRMGAQLVDSIMVARNDPRLSVYFAKDGNGLYQGAVPGQAYNPATESNLADARGGTDAGKAFRQPLATHAEVQLIIAEAAFRTGDQATALASLNAERTTAGLPTIPNTVVDSALVDSIMIEKYVVMFQNIETWNDYKRECRPRLVPASSAAGGQVIGRPLYGSSEANVNPNFPGEPPNALNSLNGRNWNDPDPCP